MFHDILRNQAALFALERTQLQSLCKERELSSDGKRGDLLRRLLDYGNGLEIVTESVDLGDDSPIFEGSNLFSHGRTTTCDSENREHSSVSCAPGSSGLAIPGAFTVRASAVEGSWQSVDAATNKTPLHPSRSSAHTVTELSVPALRKPFQLARKSYRSLRKMASNLGTNNKQDDKDLRPPIGTKVYSGRPISTQNVDNEHILGRGALNPAKLLTPRGQRLSRPLQTMRTIRVVEAPSPMSIFKQASPALDDLAAMPRTFPPSPPSTSKLPPLRPSTSALAIGIDFSFDISQTEHEELLDDPALDRSRLEPSYRFPGSFATIPPVSVLSHGRSSVTSASGQKHSGWRHNRCNNTRYQLGEQLGTSDMHTKPSGPVSYRSNKRKASAEFTPSAPNGRPLHSKMLSKSALRLDPDVVEGLVDSPRIKRMRISKAAAEAERNGVRSRSAHDVLESRTNPLAILAASTRGTLTSVKMRLSSAPDSLFRRGSVNAECIQNQTKTPLRSITSLRKSQAKFTRPKNPDQTLWIHDIDTIKATHNDLGYQTSRFKTPKSSSQELPLEAPRHSKSSRPPPPPPGFVYSLTNSVRRH